MADDQNLVQNPEGADEAVAVPEWVPEKFRDNPEKFGESYVNLEREFHETRRQLKAQQETLEQYIAAQPQQVQQPVETDNSQLYAAYENDPVATMAWLAQQSAQQAIQAALPQFQQQQQPLLKQQNDILAYTVDQMVGSRISDWNTQKQNVADYVRDRPYLLPEAALASPQNTADALEAAYKAMRYDDLQNQSQSQAEQLAQANELAKRQAQTLQGHPGNPAQSDEDTDYWESIKNAKSGKFTLS